MLEGPLERPRLYVQRGGSIVGGLSPIVWRHLTQQNYAIRSVELNHIQGRQVAISFEVSVDIVRHSFIVPNEFACARTADIERRSPKCK